MTAGNEFLDRLELGERLCDLEWTDEEPTTEHPAALPAPPHGDFNWPSPNLDRALQAERDYNRLRSDLLFAIGEAETKQQQAEAREAVALDVLAAIVARFRVTVGFLQDDDAELIRAAERLLEERR